MEIALLIAVPIVISTFLFRKRYYFVAIGELFVAIWTLAQIFNYYVLLHGGAEFNGVHTVLRILVIFPFLLFGALFCGFIFEGMSYLLVNKIMLGREQYVGRILWILYAGVVIVFTAVWSTGVFDSYFTTLISQGPSHNSFQHKLDHA